MFLRQRLFRPAPHTMLRIVFVAVDAKTQTLSDSLARRTGGSDSPLMRLLTFAPLSRCSLGPLGRVMYPIVTSRPSKSRNSQNASETNLSNIKKKLL